MWKIFWLIWFVLSAFVLIVYGWSLKVLFQQKAAWKKFAEKHKLEYDPGRKITESPRVVGRYKNHRLYLYTGVQTTADVRGQRFITIIEVEFGQGVPAGGILGTKNMEVFIANLDFDQSFTPNSKHWAESYSLKTKNAAVIKEYLTEKRLEAIGSVFSMKNADALFFFDEIDSVFRIETSDPLRNAERIERILDRVIGYCNILKLKEEEFKKLEAKAAQKHSSLPPKEDQSEDDVEK